VNVDYLRMAVEPAAERYLIANSVKIVDNADAVPACAVIENAMAAGVSMAGWKLLDEKHKGADDNVAVAAEAEIGCVVGWYIVDVRDDVFDTSRTVQSHAPAQQVLIAQISRVHCRPATVRR
jgi:hypothetical protein